MILLGFIKPINKLDEGLGSLKTESYLLFVSAKLEEPFHFSRYLFIDIG